MNNVIESNLCYYTDEELEELIAKGNREADIYKGCHDGSYEMVYMNEVYPYEKELERRKESN